MQVDSTGDATPFRLSLDKLFRRYLKKRLGSFDVGSLRLEFPNGVVINHNGSRSGPAATIRIKRWRLLHRLILEGEIGLARGYVENDWSTPNLAEVLEFGLHNEAAITSTTNGNGIVHFLNRWAHHRNANTRGGSRRNIAAHYDLGNQFYALWLDRGMTYSSAIYENADENLEVAQERKLRRTVELLDIKGGESVLEIGCGWGSLAPHIADAGAKKVHGISLSKEQINYARTRIDNTKYAKNVDFELQDYRSIAEQHDRIVSIEMFEAVGERYWPLYFEMLRKSLSKNGSAVLQIITIADELFASYRSRPDFIQQYIFPGGMLPTRAIVEQEAERAGFRIEHYEPFGLSYARTLDTWHKHFNANWPEIRELGFDDRFQRMWNYYLTYCAVGFRHGWVNVGLFKLSPVESAEIPNDVK